MDALESRVESLERRVDAHGGELDELRLRSEHDSVVLANVDATCMDIKQRIREMERRPGTRWEALVSTLVSAAAMALMAYVVARLGLS